MKTLVDSVKCVLLAATVLFLLTSCQIIVKPETQPIQENTQPNGITAESTAAKTEIFPQLTLNTLPDLSTAKAVAEGMTYTEVVNLMGPPAQLGAISTGEEKSTFVYVWPLADECGYAEVTFAKTSGISTETEITVTGIHIEELTGIGSNSSSQVSADDDSIDSDDTVDGVEPAFIITDCVWNDDDDDDEGRVIIDYKFINPKPFGIHIDDEKVYLNGEELTENDFSAFLFIAEANSIDTGSFSILKPVKDGDTLIIKGTLIEHYEREKIGTVEYTILFGDNCAEVISSKINMLFNCVKDAVKFTPVKYEQEGDCVKIYCEVRNSNPFPINLSGTRNKVSIYFNGAELSRLDWVFGMFVDANSTESETFRIYRGTKPGDKIKVKVSLYDNYTGETDIVEFEATLTD